MDPILTAAQAEREQIERELAQLKARLAELDSFLRTYSSLSGRLTGLNGLFQAAGTGGTPVHSTGAGISAAVRAPTIKDVVLAKVERLLQDGVPRHTRTLVDQLAIMGVPLRATDKVLQVSKILSNDPRFVADRSRGWTLAASTKGEGPDGGSSEPSLAAGAANHVPEQEPIRRD